MRSSVALAFAGARSTPSATRPPSAVPADARRKSRRETRILHPPVQGWIAVRVRPYHVEKIRQEPQTPIRGNTDIAMQWSRLANDARDGERELPARVGRGDDAVDVAALGRRPAVVVAREPGGAPPLALGALAVGHGLGLGAEGHLERGVD